eukprot:TRINITY_DN6392_c1_g1_i1.p1 TRINITY_DN6392_c1_g1~~TRINITY_DN6392_c1_g1_i1.p1  ORF type:complete len:216 (-),score=52.30 TRINITY_DN6392_c1_g1_i1:197-844(-)
MASEANQNPLSESEELKNENEQMRQEQESEQIQQRTVVASDADQSHEPESEKLKNENEQLRQEQESEQLQQRIATAPDADQSHSLELETLKNENAQLKQENAKMREQLDEMSSQLGAAHLELGTIRQKFVAKAIFTKSSALKNSIDKHEEEHAAEKRRLSMQLSAAKKASDDARIKAERDLERMQREMETLRKELQNVRSSSNSSWFFCGRNPAH